MKRLLLLTTLSLIVLIITIMLTSCNNEKKDTPPATEKTGDGAETKEEKNKQTALASINAMAGGDIDGALKEVAPDAIDYNDGSMPVVKGVDSIKASLKTWRSSFSSFKAENLLAVSDGDYVMVSGDWSGTFNTDFMGMKTNGKTFKVKDVDIFKFNSDGKITEHHGTQSSMSYFTSAGVPMQ